MWRVGVDRQLVVDAVGAQPLRDPVELGGGVELVVLADQEQDRRTVGGDPRGQLEQRLGAARGG